MEEAQMRAALRHNRTEIVRVLAGESDLNHVIDLMEQLGFQGHTGNELDMQVVSESMRENVRTPGRPVSEKVRQFLDGLERRGPAAYECFLSALKDQHMHLYYTLIQSCTEAYNRKYVSGNDIKIMGSDSDVQYIDYVGPSETKLRSGTNNMISVGEESEGGSEGKEVTEGSRQERDSVERCRQSMGRIVCETQQNIQRSTDLAQMRRDIQVVQLSEPTSQLFDKKRKSLNTFKEMCKRENTYCFAIWNFFSCIISGISCYLWRLGAALCNLDTSASMAVPSVPSEDNGFVNLVKDDEVFVYREQPSGAAIMSRVLAISQVGTHVLLPYDSFKKCNDPCGEEWFFPINGDTPVLCEQQLYAILEGQTTGTFVVYVPETRQVTSSDSHQHVYNLSVCYGDTFLTYPIYEYLNSEVCFSENDKYTNICSLVKHHRLNKGTYILCRLRLPYSQRNVNIGDHIEEHLKIKLDTQGSDVIGIGYASEVKRVKLIDGTLVALKVPRLSDMDCKLVQLDFMEEVKHMLAFKHGNIVRSLGVHLDAGLTHIVMEYLPNGDVQHCLLQGTFSSDDTPAMVGICVQTLSALAYLKQRRVIHRDVAARNVLVANSHPVHVKLTDFGMSRFVRKDCYIAEKNEVMALRWAAPEVLTQLKYSSSSDIWAVGMFFYEVFSSGQEPYSTIADEKILTQVVESKSIPEQPKCCPAGLYTLMTQCWKFDPCERPGVDGLLRCVRRNCRTLPPPTSQGKRARDTKLENLYTLDTSGSAHGNPKQEKYKNSAQKQGSQKHKASVTKQKKKERLNMH